MATAQSAINNMRVMLGETNPLNSRWQDIPHLLFYYNLGRREFAKKSKALKAIFQQTTVQGATTGNQWARYPLDPTVYDIDVLYWDNNEVERAATQEWDEQVFGNAPATEGTPYIYRRIGDSIDLFFAPESQKVLEVHASILTTDLVNLTDTDLELNDDQSHVASTFGVYQALTDDDRDGSLYLARFNEGTRQYDKVQNAKGPRYTNLLETPKWRL